MTLLLCAGLQRVLLSCKAARVVEDGLSKVIKHCSR